MYPTYGNDAIMPAPSFESSRAFGDEWWQKLVSYGVTRAVDAEFAQSPGANVGDYGNLGYANGQYYTRGYAGNVPGAQSGNSSILLIGAALLGIGLLIAVAKG